MKNIPQKKLYCFFKNWDVVPGKGLDVCCTLYDRNIEKMCHLIPSLSILSYLTWHVR